MPVQYSVLEEGMFVHAVASEPLTTEDVIAFQTAVWQDSRVKEGYKLLFDESKIVESHIDAGGLKVITARENSKKAKRPSKNAIVAGPGSAFPRALEYEKLVSPQKEMVIVFHSENIARKWLGV